MVAAIHYIATAEDHASLLDHLGEPDAVTLHPWPLVSSPVETWTRERALAAPQVMVVRHDLGGPVVIRPGDPAMTAGTRAGLLNRINWQRLAPGDDDGLVDSNASPVLFWEPGTSDDDVLRVSAIGAQTDSLTSVGTGYERWAKSTMSWVRRRGTKVWGLERGRTGPGLDISLSHVSSVYALPRALTAMERGTPAR